MRNAVRNSDAIFEKYGRYVRRIDRLVEDANAGLESSLAVGNLATKHLSRGRPD
jgi:hypothetical protein